MTLEDREDDVLLAQARRVLNAEGIGELDEIADRTLLQLGQVHRVLGDRSGDYLCLIDIVVDGQVVHRIAPGTQSQRLVAVSAASASASALAFHRSLPPAGGSS